MPTNVPFLKALASHPSFGEGDVDTGFIGRHRAALIPEHLSEEGAALSSKPLHKGLGKEGSYSEAEKEALAVAAVGLCLQERAALRGGLTSWVRRQMNLLEGGSKSALQNKSAWNNWGIPLHFLEPGPKLPFSGASNFDELIA
jgi:acetyl/propionyl-CoA carboxylase alpha subunit